MAKTGFYVIIFFLTIVFVVFSIISSYFFSTLQLHKVVLLAGGILAFYNFMMGNLMRIKSS